MDNNRSTPTLEETSLSDNDLGTQYDDFLTTQLSYSSDNKEIILKGLGNAKECVSQKSTNLCKIILLC